MFKKNITHVQKDLFGFFNTLPAALQQEIKQSAEYRFYNAIFCHIPEDIFSVLYSEKKSRPNAPINCLVSSLILMQRYHWTYEQLFNAMKFNLLTKIALGLDQLGDVPFSPATIYNFQNRLNKHYIETGENLLEHVFDHLTQKQLKALKLKTNIQRTDSFMAASNIRSYSRLQLLVEMIIRIYRVLSDEDQHRFQDQFRDYIKQTSGQYIYRLKASDVPHELEKIAELYEWIRENLFEAYASYEIFQIFQRVYSEHFTVVKDKITVKPSDQLSSGSVQSPDDIDATFRDKNGKKSTGQSINITETAHPDNPVNLLTDVAVHANNTDDSQVLHERIDRIKEKTPDLDELHFDGAYGSSDNDQKFAEHHITPVQTAVKGRQAAVAIAIDKTDNNEYTVSCPLQTKKAQKARKRYKAQFDRAVCHYCPFHSQCSTLETKSYRVYYFTDADYLRKKRLHQIDNIPPERRQLRNNVEATVNEFTCKFHRKKLKVRGAFKAAIFAYSVAISVNFGRIHRFIQNNPEIVKELLLLSLFFIKEHRKKSRFQNIFHVMVSIIEKIVPSLPQNAKLAV